MWFRVWLGSRCERRPGSESLSLQTVPSIRSTETQGQVQKTTSSTIISLAILALLLWALFSGLKPGEPRKNNEQEAVATVANPPGEEKTAANREEPGEKTGKKSGKRSRPKRTSHPRFRLRTRRRGKRPSSPGMSRLRSRKSFQPGKLR